MNEAPQQAPAQASPATFDPGQTAFAQSADPAKDIASAALANLFGQQPAQYQPPIQVAPAPAQPAPAQAQPANPPVPAPAQPANPQVPPPAPPPAVQPQVDITARYTDPKSPDAPAVIPDIPKEQNIQLPENSPESVGRAFAASRAEARQYRQLAESLRQQLTDMEARRGEVDKQYADLNSELAKERERVKGLEDELGRLDLTRSTEFQAKFDKPLQEIEGQVYQTLLSNGYDQNNAASAARQVVMAQSLDDLGELMQGLPDVVRGQLAYKFSEADKLWAARQQALDEWQTTSAGLEAASTRDRAAEAAHRRAELASGAMERLATTVAPMVWNDPAFAEYRSANEAKAKAWLGQAPEPQVAAAALEGMLVAPFAYKLVEGLTAEVLKLRSALDARHRAESPTVAPYYVSPPVPPAPARPAIPTTPLGNPVVTPVTAATASPVDLATGLVSDSLRGLFR